MKKLLFSILLLAGSLASCNKSYLCECKDSAGVVVATDTYTKFNKMHAKQACTNDAKHQGLSCALK